ncbi:inner centromere protein B-like [Dermacentor albipictus]|uniref:inner centromere protein B-like n=1 Tax=Dermacentor albipictus TaxID=60249 RepID=UPI0038FBFC4B
MAGTSFSLATALANLQESLKDCHQELHNVNERARAHVADVLENIKVAANSVECVLAVPKAPGRKQKARISAKKSSSTAALPKRQTRSVSKGAKKRSSPKKIVTVQDERSSTTSEDPEKENAVVQLKSAAKATRAANKKVVFGVRVNAAMPVAKPSPRQPLRSTRQTRAQAKALVADSGQATPPRAAGISRALLYSPANRVATPSKQLFSPYTKCSVQEKARAFESKEPISPMHASGPPKSSNAARNQASAAAVTKEVGLCAPLSTTQMHASSEPITEEKPVTRASLSTPVVPSPPKIASKHSSEEETPAITCVDVAPLRLPVKEIPVGRLSSVSPPECNGQSSTLRSSSPASKPHAETELAATSPAASPGAKNSAPIAPGAGAAKERRITRASASAAAALIAVSEKSSKGTPAGIQAAGRSYEVSSAAESASDDEEWVDLPTTPKRARLLPQTSPAWAHVKKVSGVLGSTKTLGEDCPGHKLSAVRKISATPSSSSSRFAPVTPKQVTPSKVARPFITSKARQGTLKGSTLKESTRKRHDSSGSSDMEQQRKQELLRIKIGAAKKDREQRLARAQAQRERREAERREQEQLRQREARQKELERLKLRTAFHQLKQSERSRNVKSAAATKRKAESPLVSASKKPTPLSISKPPKMARNACADAVAARLIFGQPSTSLSQRAKLNSLQQQAMPNSLPQSLRSQASLLPSPEEPQASSDSQSITALVESTPEKACAALNVTVTLSSEDKPAAALGETFTVPSTDHLEASVTKTPSAANCTFLRTSGPPRSSGYDITPHRSELPPEPNKDKDNYDISDLNSGDEGDDYKKPRKEVPAWAKGVALNKLVAQQHAKSISGLELLGVMPKPDLDEIFPFNKKSFNKRTSSQKWD